MFQMSRSNVTHCLIFGEVEEDKEFILRTTFLFVKHRMSSDCYLTLYRQT